MDASDDPADQDKAREIRVLHDYASLKKQIGSKKKPQKPAVEEEVGISSTVEMEKAKKEAALRRKEQQAVDKEKKALKKEEVVNETVSGGVPMTPQELEIQKKMSRLNMRLARKRNQEMQKAKVQDTETAPEQVKEDKAFDNVVSALRAKHGKDAVLTKDSPKPKVQPKPKAKPQKPLTADEKAHREVIARYGGEANYKAGRGLGT